MRYQGEETAQIEAELRWQFWKRIRPRSNILTRTEIIDCKLNTKAGRVRIRNQP
jgi:hypothetical protein